MFRAVHGAAADVPAEVGTAVPPDPIPLSHLSLDLPVPPEGWVAYLGRRGIAFRPDDLGRDSVGRGDAKRLLDERREGELRKRAKLKLAEEQAVEQDQLRRAQIWRGIPVDRMPPDVHPAAAMLQASRDAQPKRQSVLESAFANSGELTFHSMQDEAS
jgi:hypothetical protein